MGRSQHTPRKISGKTSVAVPIIVIVAVCIYFGVDRVIEEDQKSFVAKAISMKGKDDLGIRKNKGKKYYTTILNYLKEELRVAKQNGQVPPKITRQRIKRVNEYLETATK
jgi:hypothetical protein